MHGPKRDDTGESCGYGGAVLSVGQDAQVFEMHGRHLWIVRGRWRNSWS
jgi:hypothetical protein